MADNAYREFKSLLTARKFRDAASFAEREFIRRGESSAFWLSQQAVAWTRARLFKEALDAIDRALLLDPNSGWCLVYKGDICTGMERFGDALACYEEALRSRDERVVDRARNGILESLARQEKWQETLDRISQWRLSGESLMQWRARALAGSGRTDEAIEACKEWLRARPDDRQALWQITEIEIERDGLDAVRERFRKLSRIPSRPKIYKEIYAALCKRSGRIEDATSVLEGLGEQGFDFSVQRNLAFNYAKNKREDEAIPIMEALLRMKPRDMFLHTSYQSACNRKGRPERIREFYEELSLLHPQEDSIKGRLRKIENTLRKAQE